MNKTQTILKSLGVTKSQLKSMDFEDFANVADQCGWSSGSPELQNETIELMFT